jgi:pantoate--beta-alanine ligase
VPCPIVRVPDGLALSSRNVYLSAEERRAATVLYRALRTAETLALGGETDTAVLVDAMRECVAEEPLATLDYAVVADPTTLRTLDALAGSARALVAIRLGATRLIDNMQLSTGA